MAKQSAEPKDERKVRGSTICLKGKGKTAGGGCTLKKKPIASRQMDPKEGKR